MPVSLCQHGTLHLEKIFYCFGIGVGSILEPKIVEYKFRQNTLCSKILGINL